jgi:hypothetical protein
MKGNGHFTNGSGRHTPAPLLPLRDIALLAGVVAVDTTPRGPGNVLRVTAVVEPGPRRDFRACLVVEPEILSH